MHELMNYVQQPFVKKIISNPMNKLSVEHLDFEWFHNRVDKIVIQELSTRKHQLYPVEQELYLINKRSKAAHQDIHKRSKSTIFLSPFHTQCLYFYH